MSGLEAAARRSGGVLKRKPGSEVIKSKSMNKYVLADMVTERLKRETGMVAKPLPQEIKHLETAPPAERVCFDFALYQADKLKKISINKRSHGESSAGTLVMIIGADEYDLPFTLADVTFGFAGKDKMFTAFQFRPLVQDEESTRKYVEPFRKWYQAISKLPSESVTRYGQSGELLKPTPSAVKYVRGIHHDYTDQVLNFAQQFFDIFLEIYRKAEPVKDIDRRRKMDAFRAEWNKHILEDDPSSQTLIKNFGRRTAELVYEYLVYL